jgi:hypothetical protein
MRLNSVRAQGCALLQRAQTRRDTQRTGARKWIRTNRLLRRVSPAAQPLQTLQRKISYQTAHATALPLIAAAPRIISQGRQSLKQPIDRKARLLGLFWTLPPALWLEAGTRRMKTARISQNWRLMYTFQRKSGASWRTTICSKCLACAGSCVEQKLCGINCAHIEGMST